jgi:hypothetical protein
MTDSEHTETPTGGRWAVRFTWQVIQAGLEFPEHTYDQRPMTHTQAVRYAQSEWSVRHGGIRIIEAHVRQLPRGEWTPVEPASLCGAVDLATGLPVICHPVHEPDADEDGQQLPTPAGHVTHLTLTGPR